MPDEKNKLKQIISIDSDLNKIQDLDILLERILREARQAVAADAGTIYIRNENKLDFTYAQNDTMQKNLSPGQKLIYSFFSMEINKSSISGYVADALNGKGIGHEDPDILEKPFTPEALVQRVRDIIGDSSSCDGRTANTDLVR